MKNQPLAYLQEMADVATEYCSLIENLESGTQGERWIRQMGKLLPKLHSAIVMLETPDNYSLGYHMENDDKRCELFMRLHEFFLSDQDLWPDLEKYDLKLHMCESLAYDFTDMYFDLKRGLELLDIYPNQPNQAANDWQTSFSYHWRQQLVDAEGWLYAVGLSPLNGSEYSNIKSA